jgi:hypothetical protein
MFMASGAFGMTWRSVGPLASHSHADPTHYSNLSVLGRETVHNVGTNDRLGDGPDGSHPALARVVRIELDVVGVLG